MNYSDEDKKKINEAKKKYETAKANNDATGMQSAHAEAEAVRANYGISGGGDGSQEIPLGVGSGGKSGKSTVQRSNISNFGYGTYEEDLSNLAKAQQKAQIAQLKQARDKALANLDTQEKNIKPTYQNARNQASATSQSGARSFAEYLANRGLTNSGAAAQGEINRLSAYQNTLGEIDTAEANAYRDIANQRNAIQNDYVAGVANANNAIAQQYYNNLLNYNEQQRQMVQQLQQQALGQYANDYQAQINNLIAQGYSPNSLEVLQLQALRGNKVANNYSTGMNNALANIQAGNINYNNAAAVGMTAPQAQQYYNNYLAQQQAQAQAEAEALAWERQQQNIANQQKWAQINNDIANTQSLIEARKNSGGTEKIIPSLTSQKNYIDNTFAIKDEYGEVIGHDKNAILNYIKTENSAGRMTDENAVNLLYSYEMKDIADQLIGG